MLLRVGNSRETVTGHAAQLEIWKRAPAGNEKRKQKQGSSLTEAGALSPRKPQSCSAAWHSCSLILQCSDQMVFGPVGAQETKMLLHKERHQAFQNKCKYSCQQQIVSNQQLNGFTLQTVTVTTTNQMGLSASIDSESCFTSQSHDQNLPIFGTTGNINQ